MERFESKINKTNDCWLWTAHHDIDGYGIFWFEGKCVKAHRFSYLSNDGVIPEGHEIRHKCKTKNCVNPEHLETGTHTDNMRDKVRDGTTNRGNKSNTNKLTEAQVREIRLSNKSLSELGRIYNVRPTTILKIKKGINWSWLE